MTTRSSMASLKTLLTKAQLIVLLSLGVCVAALALTPPGTVIFNRASLFYELAGKEESQQALSNATRVTVGETYAFTVENTHNLNVAAGVVAQFPHRITNQGNTRDSYQFVFNTSEPPFADGAFDTPIVFHDSNSNGRIEANEPVIQQTSQLAPGAHLDVVVTARVSTTLADGQQQEFPFVVESVLSDKTRSVINRITVASAGELAISLVTAQSCSVPLFPGDPVAHSVEITNAGFSNLQGTSYIVDGVAMQGIVIELRVTTNTRFTGFESSAQNTVNGEQLVQLEGFATDEWITVDALTDGDVVIQAGYFFTADLLTGNEVAAFTTRLTAQESLQNQGSVLTTAIYDADTDQVADSVSNSTCNTFATTAAFERDELLFLQPAPELILSGQNPDFFTDTDFVSSTGYLLNRSDNDTYVTARDGMYLQLNLSAPNHPEIRTDDSGNRFVITDVASGFTGDAVSVVLLETSNSGAFRSVAPIQLSAERRSNGGTCPGIEGFNDISPRIDQENPDCVLQSDENDQLLASLGDAELATAIDSVIVVRRQSIVFDSSTLAPIPGVRLQIRRADTGEIARDTITGADYSFLSDVEGRFWLPRLLDETSYYLSVTSSDTYKFPSKVPPLLLPDFQVHGLSYGIDGIDGVERSGVFFGASINAQTAIDIPLDPQSVTPLLSVDKVALQSSVDIGQSVFYSVTVRSEVDKLSNVVVTDTLPFGFRFVAGSVTVDDQQTADPVATENGLEFSIGSLVGDLAARQSSILRYAARASAAAIDGDGINTAVASGMTTAGQSVESLPDSAKVTLQRSGVFSERAALFGKIYVDQNCDGIQSHKEWPIGGVRLYLHDGTYVITDADGLYSVYGLTPGRHVIQVDKSTLPDGLDLKPLAVEQLADADSRLIELSNGDFHRADFAAGCPASNASAIFAELKRRNKTIDNSWYLQHTEELNNRRLQSGVAANDLRRNPTTLDGDLSSGVLEAPAGFDFGSIGGSVDLTDAEIGSVEGQDEEAATQQRVLDAKQVVATVTQQQAKDGTWLWPRNSMSINGRFMAVIRAGIDPVLYVNNKPVAASQIGEHMLNHREKAQVVAWYGIELESGENTVEIKGTGPFGNERVLATGVFKRPSAGTQIKLEVNKTVLPADSGRSTLPVTISILDENGYPALGVYYVTLESSDGSWLEPDIQDNEPGRQIRVENGKRSVYYRSSGTAGEVQVRASTGSFSDQLLINQVAQKRPLLVSGFVEAAGYFATEQLGEFNATTDLGQLDERGRFETRAALFVTGTVKDKYNLTLSYDSDSDTDTELLRDVDPTLYYPVHGDASVRGFEAQSRSKLYVRVERDQNSLMWGDYVTDINADRRDLARLNRTLTGLNGVYNDGKNTLQIFAAQEENRNIVEELPGNGSALLYRLQQFPIIPNSESVELITRSLDNPDLILETVLLSRTGDYFVDDELGFLTFSSSIPTLDADQNPVFIRVTYDVERGGEEYLVSGARFDRQVGENLALGVSITHDDHETEGRNLIGVYGDYVIGSQTRVSVNLAHSDSQVTGTGQAHSISVDHNWLKNNAASSSITHQRADENFNNASALVSAGRSETRITHSQKLGQQTKLLLEANDSRSSATDEQRLALGAAVETTFKDWQAKAGLRQIRQKSPSEEDSFLTSVLGARRKYSLWGRNGEVDIEYEQDLDQIARKRIAAGAKLELHNKVTGYTRYELSNSLLGIAGQFNRFAAGSGRNLESRAFTAGVESTALRSTRLYSEYRMRGAFESTDFESASGVRGDYEIQDGLRVSPHFEYIERLGGVAGDSIAASVGLTDTRNQNSRRLIRLETRHSSETDHYGLRASVTSRLSTDWTGIISDNYSLQQNTGAETVKRHTLVAAVARRPKYNNKHHMLFLYKLQQESGVINGVDRTLNLLSTHQNLEIDESTVLSGRIGLKHDSSRFAFNRLSDFALLADARLSFDIGRRLNFDTSAGVLSTNGSAEIRYSLGLGFNYILHKNLQLSVAYNIVGFEDRDLDAQQYNARGAHIGLQYKLDEELFKWLE